MLVNVLIGADISILDTKQANKIQVVYSIFHYITENNEVFCAITRGRSQVYIIKLC